MFYTDVYIIYLYLFYISFFMMQNYTFFSYGKNKMPSAIFLLEALVSICLYVYTVLSVYAIYLVFVLQVQIYILFISIYS